MQRKSHRQHAGERDGAHVRRLSDRQALRQVVQAEPGGDGKRKRARVGRRGAVPEVAEDAPVEVDESQEARPDSDREDHRHRGERAALPLRDRRLDRAGGVGEDVPEQEDKDAGGEGVEKALDRLRQAVHPRDREAEKHGSTRDGAESDGGSLAHSGSIGLVRTKDAVRSV